MYFIIYNQIMPVLGITLSICILGILCDGFLLNNRFDKDISRPILRPSERPSPYTERPSERPSESSKISKIGHKLFLTSECPICFTLFSKDIEIYSFNCGHIICHGCFDKNQNRPCPICRYHDVADC